MNKPKIVAIVGPTAAGKTTLSIKIAQRFCGEVISADSRQIYRGLDIGSGKVTPQDMAGIPHHLLDVADINHTYSATDFTRDAGLAIDEILARQKLPVIAGGTFFYIELLRGNMSPAPVPPNPVLRAQLEQYPNEVLFSKLQGTDAARAESIDPDNRHRLIRALEIIDALGSVPEVTKVESQYDWLLLGTKIEKETLHQNIHNRLLERVAAGLIEEVRNLHTSGISFERLDSLGLEYRYVAKYLKNELSKEEMLGILETKIKQYAKRQMTWLKRDPQIEWCDPADTLAIFDRIEQFLSN